MKRNGSFYLFITIICTAFLTTACVSPAAKEKQEIADLIIQRCSKAWHDLRFNEDSTLSPKNHDWQYKQYNDRITLENKAEENPNDYNWLPQSGYLIAIGKLLLLYDNDENLIGYFGDSDHYQLNYSTSMSSSKYPNIDFSDLERAQDNVNIANFKLLMLKQSLSAFGIPNTSFEDFDFKTDEGFCILADNQIAKIK